jgi:hypothetical protein
MSTPRSLFSNWGAASLHLNAREVLVADLTALNLLPSIATLVCGFCVRLSLVGGAYVCVFQAAFDSSPRAAEERPAISTARMAVRKMPSKVPAPPIEATGAPRP